MAPLRNPKRRKGRPAHKPNRNNGVAVPSDDEEDAERNINEDIRRRQVNGGLTENTLKAYDSQRRRYIEWMETEGVDPKDFTKNISEYICKFIYYRIIMQRLGKSTLDGAYSSIKHYYCHDLNLGNRV